MQIAPKGSLHTETFGQICKRLGDRIILVHHREDAAEREIVIRFDNGYGVSILPGPAEASEELLEMMVLRFHGPGIHDHGVAQYAPVPEFSRDSGQGVIKLCEQVASLRKLCQGPPKPGFSPALQMVSA